MLLQTIPRSRLSITCISLIIWISLKVFFPEKLCFLSNPPSPTFSDGMCWENILQCFLWWPTWLFHYILWPKKLFHQTWLQFCMLVIIYILNIWYFFKSAFPASQNVACQGWVCSRPCLSCPSTSPTTSLHPTPTSPSPTKTSSHFNIYPIIHTPFCKPPPLHICQYLMSQFRFKAFKILSPITWLSRAFTLLVLICLICLLNFYINIDMLDIDMFDINIDMLAIDIDMFDIDMLDCYPGCPEYSHRSWYAATVSAQACGGPWLDRQCHSFFILIFIYFYIFAF